MERNHSRVNQTSTDLLSSWRGNCDIQLLIYESDPDRPNIKEISRVTDYVVAYQCKGNSTYLEERETTKHIIMNAESGLGGKQDLKRVCKKVMNKAATRRLISKQEASVFLADLPLTRCSEFIKTVSISKSTRLNTDKSQSSTSKKFLDHYASRGEIRARRFAGRRSHIELRSRWLRAAAGSRSAAAPRRVGGHRRQARKCAPSGDACLPTCHSERGAFARSDRCAHDP
jgi:hypothetical protein